MSVCLLGLAIYLAVMAFGTRAPVSGWEPQTITIRKGTPASRIAEMLHHQGVIEHPRVFRYLSALSGSTRKLKAGRYRFDYPLSAYEAVSKLNSGAVVYRKVTIPEGLTMAQVAGKLTTEAGVDSQELMKCFRDTSLLRSLEIFAPNLEGYLFPATYEMEWESAPKAIAQRLAATFFDNLLPAWRQEMARRGMDLHQTVIMASLVEREAQLEAERPLVASVFYNRLKAHRPLESCATVEYALPRHKNRRLTYDDLEIDSPYNTYRRIGLPPGPICNPGLRSIEAAIFPAQTGFLYFVAKGDGSHIFSKSLEEHNQAKILLKQKGLR